MSDDFLFHGRAPTDWVDGGTNGHRYTVYFADVPSEAQRHDVAAMFEGLLARGPATSGSTWSWVDRWVSFTVGERWRADAAFFTRMNEMFGALHAITPLVQVRYSNAIGPATPNLLNAPAAGWEVDAGFEASRKELLREAIRAEAARLAADSLAGEIALVPLTTDVPKPEPTTLKTSIVFGANDLIVVGRSGRIVSAASGEGGRTFPLAFVDDTDALRVVALPEISEIRTFAVGDDGTRALVAAKPVEPGLDALYDVTLATGKARKVWTSPAGTIHGVVQIGDRAFVLTDKKLHWVKVATGEEIASVAAGGMWLRSLRGGSILTAFHASNKLFVVSAAADKLKLLAKLPTQGGCTIVETPDAIHAFVLAGGTTAAFELVNVDAAYRALADKTKKKN